jgi:hypothetical protein
MPWEPIKIDPPTKPNAGAEERSAAKAREQARKRAANSTAPQRTLDAFLGPSCPLRAARETSPAALEGRRPKCLAQHGEHSCVLVGPAPPRPAHLGPHRCACGAAWSVT